MQDAVTIISHALRMLIFETGTTIRVLAPALLLTLGASLLAILLYGEALAVVLQPTEEALQTQMGNLAGLLVLGLIWMVGYTLMAVLWHRHVLLSGMDREGVMRPSPRILLSYIGRGILLALVQLLIMIPLSFALTALAVMGGGSPAVLILLSLASGVILLALGLRLSLILPAAALETRMTLPDSWEATRPVAGTIWFVALLLTAINLAVSGLIAFLPQGSALGFLIAAVVFIIEGLVLVSVLTTLYGHLVEGRSLR